MVNFGNHRDPVVGKPLNEVHLPQRVVAVQRGAGDFSDRLVEFAPTPRGAQPPRPDVVVEIDLAVLPPHRVMELQRDINQLIAQWLKLMQPASDHLAKRVDTEFLSVRIQFDHGDLECVYVHIRGLAVKQYRVPAAEPFHRSPLLIGRPYNWPAFR